MKLCSKKELKLDRQTSLAEKYYY